jgi:hypothetical protein
MMHGFGFGFPFFMGGPLVWLIIIVGGYFLIRNIIPHHFSGSAGDPQRQSDNEFTETEIYRLAAKHNGKITVLDVVTALGIEPKRAEKILELMAGGIRIRMELEDNEMVFYTFPELQRRA